MARTGLSAFAPEYRLKLTLGDYALIESLIGWSVSKPLALTRPDETVEVVSDDPRIISTAGHVPVELTSQMPS